MKYYEVCAQSGVEGAVKLFCDGLPRSARIRPLAFQNTLKRLRPGTRPLREIVGMMYATGKGVQQDHAEAGKWSFRRLRKVNTAGGSLCGRYRDGESPLRSNTELSARWAKYVADHPEFGPRQRRQNAVQPPAGAPATPARKN